MSELKAGVIVTPHDEGMCFDYGADAIAVTERETEFYLKSEADKVIEDLEESHKKEVGQLILTIEQCKRAARTLRKKKEHSNYKRCLNNAWWCLREEFYAEDCHRERWVDWAIKWYKRWTELAEKFKEVK